MLPALLLIAAAGVCGMFGISLMEAAAPTDPRLKRVSSREVIEGLLCLLAALASLVRALLDLGPVNWLLAALLALIGGNLALMACRAAADAWRGRGANAKDTYGDRSAWFAAAMLFGCAAILFAGACSAVLPLSLP